MVLGEEGKGIGAKTPLRRIKKTEPQLRAHNNQDGKKGMKKQTQERGIEKINLNAAGIDIGGSEHWVSVPPERDEQPVRKFGCYTSELKRMVKWLETCGIETVAIESTGVYWIPVFQILETSGIKVCLVNAHHVKSVPGRKSDVIDCQWLRQLHSYGLLHASFRPEDQVCQLRSYIRQRERLVQSVTVHIQRMQKALTQMNLHLRRVVTDVTGVTGMKIIRAIAAGEHNPKTLAAFRDPRIKASVEEIEAALEGDYRPEHLFVLQQELSLFDTYQAQIAQCDVAIEHCLSQFDSQVNLQTHPVPPSRKRPKSRRCSHSFDLRGELYRLTGVDFTQIDGLDVLSVQTILSEVGLDPTRFPSVKHFTSWLGLCPGSRISGGKVLSNRTRKVVNRAATAFRLAAQSLARSHSALGSFYRRIRSQAGAPKAITATAHKLARIFYHLWSTREPYLPPDADAYEQQYRQRSLASLQRQAQQLGYELVPSS